MNKPKIAIPDLQNDSFFRAVNALPVERVPVWFMRQAGRSDPEYLEYRKQVGLNLNQLFSSPEHATKISLLPLRFGVDAIIFYQDILTPLQPMGAEFIFKPGPILANPIRNIDQIEDLKRINPNQQLSFVAETLGNLRHELRGQLPILGFAGSPFTLAAFMIEGGSPKRNNIKNTLDLIKNFPQAFVRLMEKLTVMTIEYLNYQIQSGAHAVQLFESLGDLIPHDVYQRFVEPVHNKIFAALPADVASILFVKGAEHIEAMQNSGATVLSVDSSVNMAELRSKGFIVQGNLDNHRLAETETLEDIDKLVTACLNQTQGKGHIFNLSHGLLPHTPQINILRAIDCCHNFLK